VSPKSLKTVEKAAKVLKTIARQEDSIALTDLSSTLSIPPSSLHRLLASLKKVGFVKQDPKTSEYTTGDQLFSLALRVTQNMDLREIAHPYLEKLMKETGETANLVIPAPDFKEVIYVNQVESKANVRGFSLIGSRAPIHATGVGKVLLADMDWPEVIEILGEDDLEKLTENTITDVDQLREELEQVKEQGFALDREECEEGGACVAAPVEDHSGEVIAALSISGPASRILDGSLSRLVEETKRQAEELSQALKALV